MPQHQRPCPVTDCARFAAPFARGDRFGGEDLGDRPQSCPFMRESQPREHRQRLKSGDARAGPLIVTVTEHLFEMVERQKRNAPARDQLAMKFGRASAPIRIGRAHPVKPFGPMRTVRGYE